ncbi:hypothetical protein [Nonomuraea sp. NPDC049646]|uniref:hypothetical protein n=1 Tax=unclassified Nonomuraea TaxID=2593643 RepID=UPI0037A37F72
MTADSRTRNSRRTGSVIVVILVLLACLTEGVHLFGGRAERMREVYGGAFQTAHPEYQLVVNHEVSVGPLSMRLTAAGFEMHPGLRRRQSGGQIVTDVLGIVSAPAMPETTMSPLLRSFHGGVVHLFLSGSHGDVGKPVYWRSCAVYETECANTSPIELYRRWVAKLQWTDSLNLKPFGIDPGRLRQATHEGRVYGFVTYSHPKPALAELIEKPGVRTIRITASSPMAS